MSPSPCLPTILRRLSPGLAGLLLAPAASLAASATDSFTVSLEIIASCSITASDLDFGSHTGDITTEITASSTLTARCTVGTPYSIGLSLGDGAGATAAQRKLTHSDTSSVTYSLYTDAGMTSVWDNDCTTLPGAGSNCASGTGNGADEAITVYGRIPAGQSGLSEGSYSDTITATITF